MAPNQPTDQLPHQQKPQTLQEQPGPVVKETGVHKEHGHTHKHSFIHEHSLSITSIAIVITLICLYSFSEPKHSSGVVLRKCDRGLVRRRCHCSRDEISLRERFRRKPASERHSRKSRAGALPGTFAEYFSADYRRRVGGALHQMDPNANGDRSWGISSRNGRRFSGWCCSRNT